MAIFRVNWVQNRLRIENKRLLTSHERQNL